jgi:hypothetical protein
VHCILILEGKEIKKLSIEMNHTKDNATKMLNPTMQNRRLWEQQLLLMTMLQWAGNMNPECYRPERVFKDPARNTMMSPKSCCTLKYKLFDGAVKYSHVLMSTMIQPLTIRPKPIFYERPDRIWSPLCLCDGLNYKVLSKLIPCRLCFKI